MILGLVTVGISLFVRNAWQDLAAQSFRWSDLHWGWFFVAMGSYTAGMIPFWMYWHQVLHALGQRPTRWESCRAYFVGHLGKYVPGKAMVVVLRAGLVRSERTHGTVAATAVFIETLTMMAVGAFVAAGCLLPSLVHFPGLVVLAVGLMICAGVPTLPPVFRRIVVFLRVRKAHSEIETLLQGLTWSVFWRGWGWMSIGWLGYGMSLYATLQALPGKVPTLSDAPLLIGSVALAIVAGFLSLIPAGIGVRELVMLPLLAGFGPGKAILAVILVRLAWFAAEISLSTLLYFAGRPPASWQDGDQDHSKHAAPSADKSPTSPNRHSSTNSQPTDRDSSIADQPPQAARHAMS